jgi:hypothetical protein
MTNRASHSGGDDVSHGRRRRVVWALPAGLLGLGVLVGCVLWFPRLLYPPLRQAQLQSLSANDRLQRQNDRFKLQNDARAILLQGLAGAAVLAGAFAAYRQLQTGRDQLQVAQQGQITDRFTKAIDQLDATKGLAVRLGGLYALERIARDSPSDRATIAEVLCAYVRTAPRPPVSEATATGPLTSSHSEPAPTEALAVQQVPLSVRAPDVQAAATILGRWEQRLGEPPPELDLHGADIQGVSLRNAKLQGANLLGAQLRGADLAIFGRWLLDVCVKFHAAWGRRAWVA